MWCVHCVVVGGTLAHAPFDLTIHSFLQLLGRRPEWCPYIQLQWAGSSLGVQTYHHAMSCQLTVASGLFVVYCSLTPDTVHVWE